MVLVGFLRSLPSTPLERRRFRTGEEYRSSSRCSEFQSILPCGRVLAGAGFTVLLKFPLEIATPEAALFESLGSSPVRFREGLPKSVRTVRRLLAYLAQDRKYSNKKDLVAVLVVCCEPV